MLGDASPPDEAIFMTVALCPTCPAGRPEFWAEKAKDDWKVKVWHAEPCLQAGSAPWVLRMVGCESCHASDDADVQASAAVLPGFVAFHVKHGGDACPMLEVDSARVERVAAQAKRADMTRLFGDEDARRSYFGEEQ